MNLRDEANTTLPIQEKHIIRKFIEDNPTGCIFRRRAVKWKEKAALIFGIMFA